VAVRIKKGLYSTLFQTLQQATQVDLTAPYLKGGNIGFSRQHPLGPCSTDHGDRDGVPGSSNFEGAWWSARVPELGEAQDTSLDWERRNIGTTKRTRGLI
jgi:hypothetical protein